MLGDQKHWNHIGLASLETRNGGVQRWYLDQQWGWQFTLVPPPKYRSYLLVPPHRKP